MRPGGWPAERAPEFIERRAEIRITPDPFHWIGWFWKCPWCGTLRIGASPLLRWTGESIHRQYCDGRYNR